MEFESTVEDILKTVQRFRILCVGRAGVGKSSIINRVFGLDMPAVHWEVGTQSKADIENGFTPKDNQFLVIHESMGCGLGDTKTLDFIQRRLDKNLPFKDRLHAVWLCTETPRAGGRVFETGEERLLQLASEAQIPIVVVFTKYDRLVRTKRTELEEDNVNLSPEDLDKRGEEEAQKALETCVQSLENTSRRLGLKNQTIRHANISIHLGYEASISSLVEVTRDVVQEMLEGDAWVAWTVSQRAYLPFKIDACIEDGTGHYRRFLDGVRYFRVSLYDFLVEIHQDIITCWNFKDELGTLGKDEFKQLMRYLVEDVQESQNDGTSQDTSSRAMEKIFQSLVFLSRSNIVSHPDATTERFTNWLRNNTLHNSPKVRRLLMTYTIGLTVILMSLFRATWSSRITWSEVEQALKAYEHSGSRQQIHDRISLIFQQDQPISNADIFRSLFRELTTIPAPVAASTPAPHAMSESSSAQVATSESWRVRFPCLCT